MVGLIEVDVKRRAREQEQVISCHQPLKEQEEYLSQPAKDSAFQLFRFFVYMQHWSKIFSHHTRSLASKSPEIIKATRYKNRGNSSHRLNFASIRHPQSSLPSKRFERSSVKYCRLMIFSRSYSFSKKLLPLTLRLELTRVWPGLGEVGREDDIPSDKKGVVGSLMENSLLEPPIGEASLGAPPFS